MDASRLDLEILRDRMRDLPLWRSVGDAAPDYVGTINAGAHYDRMRSDPDRFAMLERDGVRCALERDGAPCQACPPSR